MQKVRKSIMLVALCGVFFGIAVISHATKPQINHLFGNFELEPLSELKAGVATTFELSFSSNRAKECGNLTTITLITRTYDYVIYERVWEVEIKPDEVHKSTFELTPPPNDTCEIFVRFDCGSINEYYHNYIVATPDSIEVWKGNPRHHLNLKPVLTDRERNDQQFLDTLTTDQLDRKYEVTIDLRDPTRLKIVENMLGELPNPSIYRGKIDQYTLRVSLRDLIKIGESYIKFEFTTPPPWDEKSKKQDELEKEKDSTDSQGFKTDLSTNRIFAGISLDSVSGLAGPGLLKTGQEIKFYLRLYTNFPPMDLLGISNGFRVYSPDGADWGSTVLDTMELGWADMFDFWHTIYSYSADGVGADTVSFLGISQFNTGIPYRFNEQSFVISIGPIDNSHNGKTICLDSSFYGGSGKWDWSYAGTPYGYRPDWDGPHCYTIFNTVEYSGYLYYLDPLPPDTNPVPMRNVKIQMWDDDLSPIPDDLLDETTTDDFGYFELGPVDNDDIYATLDVYFKIKAENDAVYVNESYNGDLYEIVTPTIDDISSGTYDTTITATLNESGAFAIADAALEMRDEWKSLSGDYAVKVQIVSEVAGIGTYYDPNQQYIRMEGVDDDALAYPDTFDRDIIQHEYTHRIEDEFNFFDEGGGTHYWDSLTDPNLAASEAFSHFLPSSQSNDPVAKDYYNQFQDHVWRNAENGEYGRNSNSHGSANNYGDSCEAAVAGILWDIYDSNDDDYDSDGIGDSLSLGANHIITVILDGDINGDRPDNMVEFWADWYLDGQWFHNQAIRDIWNEHGECCFGIRGNANYEPLEKVNIADFTFLVDFLFGNPSGPPPPCMPEGNANSDLTESVNISDVTYLNSYLWGIPSGPAPGPCQ